MLDASRPCPCASKPRNVLSEEFPIEVSEDAGCVRLVVRGQFSRARFTQVLQRVIEETTAPRNPRALIDGRDVPLSLSTITRYEISVQVADSIGRGIRLALLLLEVVDRFAETVARNRGATVRVFTDEAAALQWLGRGGAPAPVV